MAAVAPVYLIVDPSIEGYTPTLAAYPDRDAARPELAALVTMSRDGVVEVREFHGRERTKTWRVRIDETGAVRIELHHRRG